MEASYWAMLQNTCRVGKNLHVGFAFSLLLLPMVIGFAFVGTAGCHALTTALHDFVPKDVAAAAADPMHGIYNSIRSLGSDHIPVGCDIFW